jgi:SrtB family sortase
LRKRIIIRLLCFVIILGSCGFLAAYALREYETEKTAIESSETFHTSIAHTQTPSPSPPPKIGFTPIATMPITPTPLAIQQTFLDLREYYQNDDIIGYLKIDGTSIDYPVTHYKDDANIYYLSRDINKKESIAGWVYMDYENDITRDDQNIIIYGHNMRQDIMFHSLRYYQDKEFYDEHKYIIFNTLYENFVWEIFSFYRTDINFPYIQVYFQSQDEFFDLAQQMKAKSWYDTGVEVSKTDHVLTLSTCTNEEEDTRFVVNARRLSPEEIPAHLRS